jgi:hypothetical protein
MIRPTAPVAPTRATVLNTEDPSQKKTDSCQAANRNSKADNRELLGSEIKPTCLSGSDSAERFFRRDRRERLAALVEVRDS